MLGAQELFLLVRQASESFDLLRLDLADILQSLVSAQKNGDLFFELRVLVRRAGALFLSLLEFALDLTHNCVVALTHACQLSFVARLELCPQLRARLRGLHDDFLQLGDELLALLKLDLMFLLFTQQQVLQFRLLIAVLVLDQVVLRLELGELVLELSNFLSVSGLESGSFTVAQD